jgi:glycosyltransferase involved in cell wall biosynthesis
MISFRDEKITVMIPTYNQAHFIARAIESALAQNYPNLEIIVADDASTDETPRICEAFISDPRMRYVRRNENIGRVENYRTTLYEEARGDWVINLDGDDYFLDPEYLGRAFDKYREIGDESIVLICADRYESDDKIESPSESSYTWKAHDGKTLLLHYFTPNREFYIWHLTSMYRRDLALKIGFYNRDITSSDQESILRLITLGRVLHTKARVAIWQAHDGNASKELDPVKMLKNLSEYSYIRDFLISNNIYNNEVIQKWYKGAVDHTVSKSIKIFVRHLGRRRAIEFFIKARREYGASVKVFLNIKVFGRVLLGR